jgi:hypothetical protein
MDLFTAPKKERLKKRLRKNWKMERKIRRIAKNRMDRWTTMTINYIIGDWMLSPFMHLEALDNSKF